jgi:hypothetical protein
MFETLLWVKAGLHWQSFCDHSRNFAKINSKPWKICEKCLSIVNRIGGLEIH